MSAPLRLAERRAFFFDLDGTLVDSSGAHRRAYQDMLRELAPSLADDFDYELFRGRSTRNTVAALGPFESEPASWMVARKQALYRDALGRGEVVLFDGARELLVHLAERGVALWLVTSASRHAAEAVLHRFDLRALFAGIVGGEEVEHSKPHPAIFELALSRSEVAPEHALTVEDAKSGADASRAARVDVVMVNVPAAADQTDGVTRFTSIAAFFQFVRAELP